MPERSKPHLEEEFRRAVVALQAYVENRNNRLSGPEYDRLLDEVFALRDALVSAK